MVFLKERIGKLIEYLDKLRFLQSYPVGPYRMKQTRERFGDICGLDTSQWEEMGQVPLWGGHREYFWFETRVSVPEGSEGRCLVYELSTGKEGQWDAVNPQFSVYVNGELKQGFDVNHRRAVLTEKARGGEEFRIVLSAFTGDRNFDLKLESSLRILDKKTEDYYYDLKALFDTACLLEADSDEYIAIIRCLNESLNRLDLRREGSEAYYESMEAAHRYLREEFYDQSCSSSRGPEVYCVGHTHIDCAWQWTLEVTRDKAVRSFATVLELMRRYPEYRFMSSQPQLYLFVKQRAPEIYRQIKERVREGRWETEGGMFVEADCNLASGESLVRQFLYGKRFFQREFGKDNVILWLPDVFGYSAALPQIMKKCGIRYFMTTKISWNEFNRMPYDTFLWEGIDGTRILTHFPPTRDYKSGGREDGNENEHYTTYNGFLNPSQLKGGWERYQPKYLNRQILMCFGYGDGGGGATEEMLENYRRLSLGIPGCPRARMSSAREFFEDLEKNVRDNPHLPLWTGELYLEYHRGTYTSMGRNKRYNRKAEFATQNGEFWAAVSRYEMGSDYPKEEFDRVWEAVLRNQFHDILPGSSIKEVYDDSREEYETVLKTDREITGRALERLSGRISGAEGDLIAFNPAGPVGREALEFEYEEEKKGDLSELLLISDGKRQGIAQRTENGRYIFEAWGIPEKGYKRFRIQGTGHISVETGGLIVTRNHLENRFFSIDINEKGQFGRIYDKLGGREVLKRGCAGNVIMSYEDRPHKYDAWDINHYYEEKAWEVGQTERIEVTEQGPVRGCLTVGRRYLDSYIEQRIYIYSEIARIDIENRIDWREHQIFLKTLFPLDIHTDEAVFDIQFGNVKRPTHQNTSWDFAKFEVCAHKWLDVSEDGYGVSFLNDCKYGCSVRGAVVGLSMLKSGIFPNPQADQEFHLFTYSIYPHRGGWREAGTVGQAYQLNNPPVVLRKRQAGGELPAEYSWLSLDCRHAVLESVKRAEDRDSLILRIYECFNRRGAVCLWLGVSVIQAWECSMMEERERELKVEGTEIWIDMGPYEIKTVELVCCPSAERL